MVFLWVISTGITMPTFIFLFVLVFVFASVFVTMFVLLVLLVLILVPVFVLFMLLLLLFILAFWFSCNSWNPFVRLLKGKQGISTDLVPKKKKGIACQLISARIVNLSILKITENYLQQANQWEPFPLVEKPPWEYLSQKAEYEHLYLWRKMYSE